MRTTRWVWFQPFDLFKGLFQEYIGGHRKHILILPYGRQGKDVNRVSSGVFARPRYWKMLLLTDGGLNLAGILLRIHLLIDYSEK